jgi:hypothetical protein
MLKVRRVVKTKSRVWNMWGTKRWCWRIASLGSYIGRFRHPLEAFLEHVNCTDREEIDRLTF